MATVHSRKRVRTLFKAWATTRKRSSARAVLHSVERMNAILERERMRAERGRAEFSLLTFTFARTSDEAQLAAFAQVLAARLRVLDEAGLLEPRCVGIVLPETSAAGAWKLCDDIFDLLPETVQLPKCDVYTYSAGQGSSHSDAAGHKDSTVDERPARPLNMFFVRPLPLWKRVVDVAGSFAGLTLAAPLLLLAAVLIKVTSRGPIFFSQQRHAMGGRPFTIYKFRTMCVDAERQKSGLRRFSEQDGPAFKMANDPRVTRLGRFLRKTSIDELPQLFNVLKGDMSLVGPRPLPCDESNRCEAWQRRRLDVTPGLTCIWQIRGRSAVSFAEWVRMDVQYIQSRSLVNDLKLIAQTVPAVVLSRGAC
jgi:lipopolysaccharide/colanic/teichoic acid biosynthesis glycosyltransferase